jgi:hypothetical protein
MLPDNFRFVVENRLGVTIDANKIVIKYRGKYYDSAGKLNFESESSDVLSQSSTISDDAYFTGSTIDNGNKTNPIVAADVHVNVDLSGNTGTPNGWLAVHLQRATADTPVWPTEGVARQHTMMFFTEITSKVDRDYVVEVE